MTVLKKTTCFLFAGLMLFGLIGCKQSRQGELTEPLATDVPSQELSVSSDGTDPEISPDSFSAPDYSVEPEVRPSDIPIPTRAPIDGDITTKFPNYDTGSDADYSYQSDELRIAIRTYNDADIRQVYYVADIWVRNIHSFRTGFGRGEFNTGTEDVEAFAVREHAVFGVNGSYNQGLVIHNGEQKKNVDKDSEKHRGVAVLYADGTMKVFNLNKDKFNLDAEKAKGIVHAWQFGPALIQDGEICQKFASYGTKHPRLILGYYEPGHYVVVAVDGRSKTSVGMSSSEMAELMKALGCKEAMNLDGGTSAVMTFMGKVISNPSGEDKDGDGRAGRNLKDMILFAEYDSEGNAPALSDLPSEKYKVK